MDREIVFKIIADASKAKRELNDLSKNIKNVEDGQTSLSASSDANSKSNKNQSISAEGLNNALKNLSNSQRTTSAVTQTSTEANKKNAESHNTIRISSSQLTSALDTLRQARLNETNAAHASSQASKDNESAYAALRNSLAQLAPAMAAIQAAHAENASSANESTHANDAHATSLNNLSNSTNQAASAIHSVGSAHTENVTSTNADTNATEANATSANHAAANHSTLAGVLSALSQAHQQNTISTSNNTTAHEQNSSVVSRVGTAYDNLTGKLSRLITEQNSYEGTLSSVTQAEERAARARRSSIQAALDSMNAQKALKATEAALVQAQQDEGTSTERITALHNELDRAQMRVAETAQRLIAVRRKEASAMKVLDNELTASQSRFNQLKSAMQGVGSTFGGVGDGARAILGVFGQFARLSIVPIFTQLIPLVGSLAGGFIALASAIAPAVGILGSLPSIIMGAGMAFGVLKSSFGGIGAALKAYSTQQAQAAAGTGKNTAAARNQAIAVRNARQALQSAKENAARSESKAAQAVRDAETNAAESIKKAYRSLSDARKQAAEDNASAAKRVTEVSQKAAEDNAKAARDTSDAVQKAAEDNKRAAQETSDAISRAAENDKKAAQDVATAREAAARQIESAQKDVADAERSLQDAQISAKRAQDDLSQARLDAIQYLKDMQRAVRDTAFSEEEAVLSLERARERLQKVNSDPGASSLDRRQADLDYREAQARLSDAQEAKRKAISDNAEAQKKGIEGSDIMVNANQKAADAAQKVIDAQSRLVESQRSLATAQVEAANRISDALQNQAKTHQDGVKAIAAAQENQNKTAQEGARSIADAQAKQVKTAQEGASAIADAKAQQVKTAQDSARAISDAEENVAKTQRDAARSVADAKASQAETIRSSNESIAKAQQSLNDALQKQDMSSATAGANAYKTAMDKLTPSQRKFTEFLIANKGRLADLKEAASSSFLPVLESAMRRAMPVLPILKNGLSSMGKAMGGFATGVSKSLSSAQNLSALDRIFDSNAKAVSNASNGSEGFTNAIIRISDAARPLTEWLGKLVGDFGRYLDRVTRTNQANGDMSRYFARTKDTLSVLGRIFRNVGGIMGAFGKASRDTGRTMLGEFEKWTEKLNKFLNSAEGQDQLKKWFEDVKKQLDHVWPVFQKIGSALKDLTVSKGFSDFMDSLSKDGGGIDTFKNLLKTISDSDLPANSADVLSKMGQVITNLANSGGVSTFENWGKALGLVADGAAALAKVPGAGAVLAGLVAATATTKAVRGANQVLTDNPIGSYVKKKRVEKKTAKQQAAAANSSSSSNDSSGGAATDAQDSGHAVGANVANGFVAGVKDAKNDIDKVAKALANQFISQANDTFDIHSPSRVMRTMGKNVVSGFTLGIGDKLGSVGDAAESLENKVSSVLKSVPSDIRTSGKNAGEAYAEGFSKALGSVKAPTVDVKTNTSSDSSSQSDKTVSDSSSNPISIGSSSSSAKDDVENKNKKKTKGGKGGIRGRAKSMATGIDADSISNASGALGELSAFIPQLTVLATVLDLVSLGMGLLGTSATTAAVGEEVATVATTEMTVSTEALAVAENSVLWPIMLIIAAIALVAFALYELYQHNETFRKAVDSAWNWIKNAISTAWNDWIKPAFEAIWHFITDTLVPAFQAVWNKVKEVWPAISNAIQQAWNNWIKPALAAIWNFIINTLVPVFNTLWGWVKNVWNWISSAISWAWNNLIKPVFSAIWGFITNTLIPVFNTLWGWVKNVWNWISSAISWAWNNLIKPVFNALWGFIKNTLVPIFQSIWDKVKAVFKGIGDAISWAWNRVMKPIFDAITGFFNRTLKPAFQAVWDKVKSVWESVSGKTKEVWDRVKNGLNTFKDWLTSKFTGAFESAKKTISGIWDQLKGIAKKPIEFVWNTVIRGGLIGKFNNLADKLGLKSLHIDVPELKLASGGRVPGSSPHARADNIPAMLTAGEWVQPVASVQHYGPQFMEAIRTRKLPKSAIENWASGGEAGSDEKKRRKRREQSRYTSEDAQWYRYRDGGSVGSSDAGSTYSVPSLAPRYVSPDSDGVVRLGEGGAPRTGYSYPWMSAVVRSQFPDARITSTLRPGARTAGDGSMSYHAIGRAVDIAASAPRMRQIARWLAQNYGATAHDLIHSPEFCRHSMHMGKWYGILPRTYADHFDHVHWGLEIGSDGGTKSLGGKALDFLKGAGGKIADVVMSVTDALGGLNPLNLLKNAYTGLLDKIPGGANVFGGILKELPGKFLSGMVSKLEEAFGFGGGSDGTTDVPAGGGSGSRAPAAWRPEVIIALRANGLPTSEAYIQAVIRQIKTESGGNPRAIQTVHDQNWPHDKARGLLQVIPSAWPQYAFPGHNDPFNGLDSLLAGINIAKRNRRGFLNTVGNGIGYGAYAEGGPVAGYGNTDSVKAMLMPGEFVIRKEAVKRIGASTLHQLNNIDRPGRSNLGSKSVGGTQHFATGGMVAPSGPISGIKPGARGWGWKLVRQLFNLPINGTGFDQNVGHDGWWNDLTAAYQKNNYTVPSLESASKPKTAPPMDTLFSWLNSFMSAARPVTTNRILSIGLKTLGFKSTSTNSITVREMQKIVGTRVDGIIGRNTLAALRKWKDAHKVPRNAKNEWDSTTQRYMSQDNFPERWSGITPRLWRVANRFNGNMFNVAPWFISNKAQVESRVPKFLRGKLLWDAENVGDGGAITSSWIKGLQALIGAPQTGKFGGTSSATDDYSSSSKTGVDMAAAIKYVLDKGLNRPTATVFPPWWELDPIQEAIQNQAKANADQTEFLKALDTLSSWGLNYLVEDLQSQGVGSLPIAKSALASRPLATQYNTELKRKSDLSATGTEDYTKFVATVQAPGEQLGIRKLAQALGMADFAIVDMWKKLVAAGRIKPGGERTAMLERDVRLFDRGVFYANTGGRVPGFGDSDSVPAMLTPGEFVLRKAAVKAIGLDNLYKLNAQTYNAGGLVYNMGASSMRTDLNALGAVASNLRANVNAQPVVINNNTTFNTTINNPVREPSTKSMNKMLRQRAVLGGSTVTTDSTKVNGDN